MVVWELPNDTAQPRSTLLNATKRSYNHQKKSSKNRPVASNSVLCVVLFARQCFSIALPGAPDFFVVFCRCSTFTFSLLCCSLSCSRPPICWCNAWSTTSVRLQSQTLWCPRRRRLPLRHRAKPRRTIGATTRRDVSSCRVRAVAPCAHARRRCASRWPPFRARPFTPVHTNNVASPSCYAHPIAVSDRVPHCLRAAAAVLRLLQCVADLSQFLGATVRTRFAHTTRSSLRAQRL